MRLRVGRAIAKTEEEAAQELMQQIKDRGHTQSPPAIATDGKGAYREAMVETWGKVPDQKPSGKGLPPEKKQPQPGWHYLQVVKHREGGRVVEVEVDVIYGDKTTLELVGAHTSYVERTNLTSRHMNGRLVRKTLSFSKEVEMLKASSVWEDAVYNLTRPVKTLRTEIDGIAVNQSGSDNTQTDGIGTNQSIANEVKVNQIETKVKKSKRRYQQSAAEDSLRHLLLFDLRGSLHHFRYTVTNLSDKEP